MANKKVFLGVPCRDSIIPEAQQGLQLPAQEVDWQLEIGKGPLLANVFNGLWCLALNSRKTHGWDYFAFHHADIQAPACWLDVMVGEAERTGAEMLSAVVCLKEPTGKTSTAIWNPQTWRYRRLTLQEIFRLPETFAAGNLRDYLELPASPVLLVNTGLLLCRFTSDWIFPPFCWHVDDAIEELPDGRFVPVTNPEDWNASRFMADRRLPVAATRKVRVIHHGAAAFDAGSAWGQETDSDERFPQVS